MKIYSSLTEAFDRAQAIYGPAKEWIQSGSLAEINTKFAKRITEFMKISKDCETTTGKGCFSSAQVKYFNGTPDYNFSYDTDCGPLGPCGNYRVITTNGTSILFEYTGRAILVDIDGPNKGKNMHGSDLFVFSLVEANNEMSIVPRGNDFTYEQFKSSCFTKGLSCTAWVINYGNIDYLKADSTGKCKDNPSITLDGVNNTSCH